MRKHRFGTLVALIAVSSLVASTNPAAGAFPGTNGKIAFASNRTGTFDIFTANGDGSGLANLTATPGLDELDPAWSADGRRLAFARDGAIWVMDADGGGQAQLTSGSPAGEVDSGPAWSPSGSEIAFARSDTSGNSGIWAISLNGGSARQLTARTGDTGQDRFPSWSPDGSTIAFQRDTRGAASRLALVNSAGGTADLVDTGISSSNAHPSWSPDGTEIAIDVNGGEGIAVFQRNGTRIPLAVFLFGSDPEWSPDGSAIVYTSFGQISWSALDGSTSGNLGSGRSATWQPAPAAPPPNTPAGPNVSVALGAVTITFADVAAPGETTVTASSSGPPVPNFFQIASDYYELSTTATWDTAAGAQVCFSYSDSTPPQIVHFVGGQATIVETTAGVGQQVCGTVNSFSPFVLVRTAADTDGPTITCGTADGAWHADNVSIQCTASDGGSGLADPADASFTLETNVPAGVETDNAATSSHDVCDVAGNCATAAPIAGNKVDRKAPALTVPADVVVDATKPFAADVTLVPATASDGGSGVQTVNCPVGLQTFPLGTTTIGCSAVDGVGNTSVRGYSVTVRDVDGPTLSLPSNLIVNATSPAGATITYAASASDVGAPPATLNCSPASGTTLAIGQTTVNCTATDAVGNSSTGSFTVKVLGAKEQLADLIQKVVNTSQLSPAAKTLLIGKLNQLLASFDPNNATQRQAVCLALQVFKAAVQLQAGKTITQAQAAEWIADANRIRAVLAC
jgi:WD40-like Beta Propeller Repeat/HYR domain